MTVLLPEEGRFCKTHFIQVIIKLLSYSILTLYYIIVHEGVQTNRVTNSLGYILRYRTTAKQPRRARGLPRGVSNSTTRDQPTSDNIGLGIVNHNVKARSSQPSYVANARCSPRHSSLGVGPCCVRSIATTSALSLSHAERPSSGARAA